MGRVQTGGDCWLVPIPSGADGSVAPPLLALSLPKLPSDVLLHSHLLFPCILFKNLILEVRI